MIRLSILDQSIISQGNSPKQEIHNTVKLAQIAEDLGYYRFWVSEHHLETLAHSSPEVLIPHLAANTSRIRIGSGGVMLPHYSAYKVAENFRLLEALYPGRIDLGVGRAPGGMPLATMALQEGKQAEHDRYAQQIEDIIFYLTGSKHPNHRFKGLKAMPEIDTIPEVWLLGSSGGSAGLATAAGISYAYAQFISGEHGANIINKYQKSFQGTKVQQEPRAMVGLFVVCGETDREAENLALPLDVQFLKAVKGEKDTGIISPELAANYPFTKADLHVVRENRKKVLVGSPNTIKSRLIQLSEEYQTEEFILASTIYDFHAKVKSYQLLAEAFDLNNG